MTTSKKVKFDTEVLGELKRSFAVDVTNIDTKTRAMKKLRTIDDMLKEPLPPIMRKKDAEPRKASVATASRGMHNQLHNVALFNLRDL